MTSIQKKAAFVGLLTTCILTLAASLGVFARWERSMIDLRFRHARTTAEPMSDEIVHVDIDDGAIETVGRWPWPRTKLALAVDELRRAGAKTIVFDLLLDDPSRESAEDVALADAIAKVPSVLALATTDSWEFDEAWNTRAGLSERWRLLDVLAEDVSAHPEEAADRAELSGDRRDRFRVRPIAFKQVAIWRHLVQRMADVDPPTSLDAFVGELSPAAREGVAIPEFKMIEKAWKQYQSWAELERHMLGQRTAKLSRDQPPIPELARAAASVGYVDVGQEFDLDYAVRFVSPTRRTPVGDALQLGLVAALVHRDIDPQSVRISHDAIVSGNGSLPLAGGRLWLYWPTSETEPKWEGLLRQTEYDLPTHGHLSIGAVVELAEMRARYEQYQQDHERIARQCAREILGLDVPDAEPIDEATLAEVRDLFDFWLEGLADPPDLSGYSEQERQEIETLLRFRDLDRELPIARAALPQPETQLRSQVQGKLVFIGWMGTGAIADVVLTPVGAQTPGVVVHSVVASQFLQNQFVRFPPRWTVSVLAMLLGILGTLLSTRFGGVASGLLTLAGLAAFVTVCFIGFDQLQLLLPVAAPTTTGAAAWLTCTAVAEALYQRDRARITRQFRARVSGELVDYLIDNPSALSMSGAEREVTVVFCDLANFTGISAKLGGPTTVTLLNRYMNALTEHITAHNGYVNKFLGDGLMAFWSAFTPDPDQACEATQSVIECRQAIAELNRLPEFSSLPDMSMRAGVTTGTVIIGDCGAPPDLNDYTVIGDPVNLAARLESACKQFGANALIDGSTRNALNGRLETADVRFVGRLLVVGQSTPVDVYELLAADAPPHQVDRSNAAIEAFRAGRLSESRELWVQYIAAFGDSPLARTYLAAIDRDTRGDGVLRLTFK